MTYALLSSLDHKRHSILMLPCYRLPQLMASCSEDCTVKVWGIPEDGYKQTETEALIDLHGHGRKVTLLRFHPTANNVLAR